MYGQIPTEYEEQCLLTNYLEERDLLFSKAAQETFTKSWAQKAKNKRSGLRKGLPDMFVIVPADRSRSGQQTLLAIEMKRTKGGVTSKEQVEWISALNAVPGAEAAVCRGFDEARTFVDRFLK